MRICLFIIISFFGTLSAEIKLIYRECDWATHQPVLCEIAKITTGPIIEFGCGNSSTSILHEICKKQNRLLISLDDDWNWIQKFAKKYLGDGYEEDNSGWHKFFFVPGKPTNPDPDDPDQNADYWVKFLESCELLKNTQFDICFIDQWPWNGRVETIKRLKDKARYIILHDCDFFVPRHFGKWISLTDGTNNIPGVIDFSDLFKSYKVYFPAKPWPGFTGPPTLLGSNFVDDLPEIDYETYPNELVYE